MTSVALKKAPEPTLLDEDGLISDFSFWTEDLARELAREEGIKELGEGHWKLIGALRSEYERLAAISSIRNVCQQAGIDRGEVNKLFGYCLVAWRVAGLPNPGEEAKSYLGGM
ncbi:MAG: TusE/DsrC/DsvC family sulfur relay protein [Hyphomicrobiaceae bacterium]|nr:TusE/DsrC/DsvC family sulfur relay protein [Hyphomicrobiaceae bacterium]